MTDYGTKNTATAFELAPLPRHVRARDAVIDRRAEHCGLPGAAASQDNVPRDLKAVVESGVLRVAVMKFDLPAFQWRDAGSLAGPEILLAREIARALDISILFVDDAASFNAVVDAVAAGRADIGISKLSQTYSRLKLVRFSEPYITLYHGLLFDRSAVAGQSGAGRSGDLAPGDVLRTFGGRIGVIRGSSYVDFARRNFPAAEVVGMANWTAAIEGLLTGKVDAIYRDEFEIRRVLKNRPALNVRFGAAVVSDQMDYLSVAICDTCAKLQQFINLHLTRTQGAFSMQALMSADLRD